MDFTGTSGDDTITGTTGDDLFKVYQGGNDTVSGLTGNDVFNFAGTLTAADTIDGGGGQDTVQIKGDYSAGIVFGATTMVNVETLTVGAGFNYTITTDDATVAAGAVLTLNASALAEANALTFNGSAETDGLLHVHGGAGNDTIGMGANMNVDDHFDGGAGFDELILGENGDLTFKSVTIHNIEKIALLPTFNGTLAFNSGNVLAGQTIEIDATGLTGSSYYTLNANNLAGDVVFDGSPREAKLIGGSGDDTFNMGANFTRADRITGGTGNDTLNLNGDYNLTLASGTIANIDQMNLAGGHNYHLTSTNNLATDQTMAVNATGLTASDSLFLDFSSETLGSVIIDGGAAPAILKGTQQGDAFDFAVTSQGGLVASDQIDGQGGVDRLYFDGDYTGSHALVLTNSTVVSIEEFDFEAGHSYNITLASHTVVNDDTLTVDASLLGAADSLTFDGSTLVRPSPSSDEGLQLTGGAGNDTLTGCYGNNTYDLSKGGEDTAGSTAFGSNNYFTMGGAFDAGDRLTGSSNIPPNTVDLNGDYTGANAVVMTDTTMSGIGQMNFEHGHSYDITTTDANIAAGKVFTVEAEFLTTSDHLRFDGAAETNGAFEFISGHGGDDFTGGSGADTFVYEVGDPFTGANRDIIHNFDAASDLFQYNIVGTENTAVTIGNVSAATIDADLTSLLTASRLSANAFVLVTPKSGNLAGHHFLVVDGNGVAGYQAGHDLVIELQDGVNLNITTANFHD